METINDRIKKLRVKSRLSQVELADILGIAQRTVSDIERGTCLPTLKHIENLCRYFNVTSDYLIFGIGDAPTSVERDILNEIREDSAVYNALIHRVTAKKTINSLCITV